MNKFIIAGTAFLLAAGSTLAQEPAPPPPPPATAQTEPMADAPPPPPKPMPNGPKDGGPRHGGPRDGMRERMMMPPPPPSKGAHFRIEQGETKIDIKCADDEPMKACGDLLMQLIDKIND